MRQTSQEFVASVLQDDGLGDHASERRHPRREPRRHAAVVQREERRPCLGHVGMVAGERLPRHSLAGGPLSARAGATRSGEHSRDFDVNHRRLACNLWVAYLGNLWRWPHTPEVGVRAPPRL